MDLDRNARAQAAQLLIDLHIRGIRAYSSYALEDRRDYDEGTLPALKAAGVVIESVTLSFTDEDTGDEAQLWRGDPAKQPTGDALVRLVRREDLGNGIDDDELLEGIQQTTRYFIAEPDAVRAEISLVEQRFSGYEVARQAEVTRAILRACGLDAPPSFPAPNPEDNEALGARVHTELTAFVEAVAARTPQDVDDTQWVATVVHETLKGGALLRDAYRPIVVTAACRWLKCSRETPEEEAEAIK